MQSELDRSSCFGHCACCLNNSHASKSNSQW